MPDNVLIPETTDAAPVWREAGRSAEWNELFAALAKAQGEIGGAKKDSTNPHFKSSYADLASVRDVTQEPLSKNGLVVIQFPRTAGGGVEIETILGHSSGQYMTGVLWMPVARMDAHGVGSAITYGRRYALMAVTGVAPVDDDGNGASDRSGVPGSAGGGTDFRPPGPRRPVINPPPAEAKSAIDAVDPADRHLVKGDGRSTYQIATAEKSPGRTMAEFWASEILLLLQQPGYDLLQYREWLGTPCTSKGTKTNQQKLVEMREKHPDLADKIDEAASNLKVAA